MSHIVRTKEDSNHWGHFTVGFGFGVSVALFLVWFVTHFMNRCIAPAGVC
jgi:hypothetical protein